MDKYILERDGQLDFYKVFLPRVNPALDIDEILADNNDGVINGNLLEFKLHVTDLNAVLFQCIKYLSALRVKGKPVPANILIIDVNAATLWLYRSAPYLSDIEKLYFGGASKDNSGFIGCNAETVLHFDKPLDVESIVTLLKECNYTKIHIDENCIVGWAMSFYKAVPMARKEDFLGDDTGKHKTIGEIRKPVHFERYIYPYTGQTNVKFNYLMDKLNDTLQKKNLGAFYTHKLYAEKSLELVRAAIARVPTGNDYIILDRCAGTGNLEAGLTDEELSHCVVSTVEYYEYKVLQELLGAKVRHIIPPIEMTDTFNTGLVSGADALSKEYIENPVIKQYIANPQCTIILFENPPYAETTSAEHQRQGQSKKSSTWKQSYVVTEMKKEVKGTASNDLGNVFIWSGFKYYLRQPTDSYIVYSPVKYWKAQHLIDRKFVKGFAYNRRHFHTNIDACIMCAYWQNIADSRKEIEIAAYDIDDNTGTLVSCGLLPVKQVFTTYSKIYYDKRPIPDEQRTGILQGASASRPGMAYPARLSRSSGYNFINLGLSGNGKMEKEVAEMLADIDADAFILDCIPNPSPKEITDRTVDFVMTLHQKHPDTPIIVIQTLIRETGNFNRKARENVKRQNEAIAEQVEVLRKKNVKNLYFIKEDQFLGTDHEGTVDGTHPNDLGFDRMLKKYKPAISKILKIKFKAE